MRFQKSIFILFLCALLADVPAAQAGYVDNHDGTVTDNGTGLMWQQVTAPGTYTWEAALAYCEDLDFADYTDWRLPTVKELESLADKSRYNKAINPAAFPDTVASIYWSSTTSAFNNRYAWYVNFNYGPVASGHIKTDAACVRAVRAGQYGSFDNVTLWPVPDTGQTKCYDNTTETACPQPGEAFYGQDASYSINTPAYSKLDDSCNPLPDNATAWAMVRDAVTGLVWENKTDDSSIHDKDNRYQWYDGSTGTPGNGNDTMDFISALNAEGGYTDWRMPTEKDLQTIVDYSLFLPDPSINSTYFPDTATSHYWSSITCAHDPGSAWYTNFSYGTVSYYSKADGFLFVRAVRSGQCGAFGDLFIYKSGSGAGTVTSADGRIGCGSHCTEAYIQDTEVMLAAAAASGSTFTGWSGGGCSGTGACTVTMIEDTAITASFTVNPTTYYRDADGDGYGDEDVSTQDYSQPDGYVTDSTDCDDSNPDIHPGALFLVNNCGLPCAEIVVNRDQDGDGYGDPAQWLSICWESLPGYVDDGSDCNDSNSTVHPNGAENCTNGIDDNCDNVTDGCEPGECGYWQGTWQFSYSSGIDNVTLTDICSDPDAGQPGNVKPACMYSMFLTCQAKGRRASDNMTIMIGQTYMDQRIYAYYETWTPGGDTPYDAVYYRDPADNASFVTDPFGYTGGYLPMIPGSITGCDFAAAIDGSFTVYSAAYPDGAPYANTFGLVSGARLTPECPAPVTTTTTTIDSTTTTTIGGTTTTTSLEPTTTTTSIELTTTTTSLEPTTTTTIGGTTTTTTVSGRPCPIARTLGDKDPTVERLRAFRDSRLAKSTVGQKIIDIYYTNAGSIDEALDHSPALRAAARRVLEVIAPMVGKH